MSGGAEQVQQDLLSAPFPGLQEEEGGADGMFHQFAYMNARCARNKPIEGIEVIHRANPSDLPGELFVTEAGKKTTEELELAHDLKQRVIQEGGVALLFGKIAHNAPLYQPGPSLFDPGVLRFAVQTKKKVVGVFMCQVGLERHRMEFIDDNGPLSISCSYIVAPVLQMQPVPAMDKDRDDKKQAKHTEDDQGKRRPESLCRRRHGEEKAKRNEVEVGLEGLLGES